MQANIPIKERKMKPQNKVSSSNGSNVKTNKKKIICHPCQPIAQMKHQSTLKESKESSNSEEESASEVNIHGSMLHLRFFFLLYSIIKYIENFHNPV